MLLRGEPWFVPCSSVLSVASLSFVDMELVTDSFSLQRACLESQCREVLAAKHDERL